MIISVSGNILSGKTTLAKKISSLFNYTYIPKNRNELFFLNDFFTNIPQYFYQTQTSFLISKALEINSKNDNCSNLVIDRSIFEDINIFAQFWIDNYSIDEREIMLYNKLSNYIINSLPKTDIYIYCKCQIETILKRFSRRERRDFELNYPDDYLQKLCEKYDKIEFPNDSMVVEVNSETLDFNNDKDVIEIVMFIKNQIYKAIEDKQISFFDQDIEKSDYSPSIKVINSYWPDNSLSPQFIIRKKTVYVAAPFTEFASEIPKSSNELDLFSNEKREYFILPIKYQRFLSRIKKYILSLGCYDVILPHKDENNWGKTYISSDKVIIGMISNIRKSDLIIAIISNSIGVHMEIAMMAVLNKPIIILVVEDLSNSFYADGFKNRRHTLVVKIKSLECVEEVIKSETVTSFIREELNNEENKIMDYEIL